MGKRKEMEGKSRIASFWFCLIGEEENSNTIENQISHFHSLKSAHFRWRERERERRGSYMLTLKENQTIRLMVILKKIIIKIKNL